MNTAFVQHSGLNATQARFMWSLEGGGISTRGRLEERIETSGIREVQILVESGHNPRESSRKRRKKQKGRITDTRELVGKMWVGGLGTCGRSSQFTCSGRLSFIVSRSPALTYQLTLVLPYIHHGSQERYAPLFYLSTPVSTS